ncbi:MAG: MOSC N-terminal beta barrel domain-containing protein [Methylococcales bacterium]|nr:MOSC domain-containing protein [Methylococcaceae bacterium]
MTSITLTEIHVYPVKSLSGIQVNHWPVNKNGLLYDRKWMLIDINRQFLSQRTTPRMTLIKTALTNEHLILSTPGMADLILPLHPSGGEVIDSTIWHDQCAARSTSIDADKWLSHFLGIECRLVYQPEDLIRPVNPDFSNPSDQVSFADGFPFLLVSQESLNALNHEMQLNLPMIRFRPNLVVSGCISYEEDTWRKISIGNIGFRLTKPCARCLVPTIDPETATTGKEPLTTLNRTRKWQNKIYFGQNALHDQIGELSVGDIIQIHTSGSNQPPL